MKRHLKTTAAWWANAALAVLVTGTTVQNVNGQAAAGGGAGTGAGPSGSTSSPSGPTGSFSSSRGAANSPAGTTDTRGNASVSPSGVLDQNNASQNLLRQRNQLQQGGLNQQGPSGSQSPQGQTNPINQLRQQQQSQQNQFGQPAYRGSGRRLIDTDPQGMFDQDVKAGQQGWVGQPPLRRGQTRQETTDTQSVQQQSRQGSLASLGIQFGTPRNNRLVIQRVTPNGLAEVIGLEAGDQIVTADGQRIGDQQQLNNVLQRRMAQAGTTRNAQIPIVVRRGGSLETLYWTTRGLSIAGYGPPMGNRGMNSRGGYTAGYAPNSDPNVKTAERGEFAGEDNRAGRVNEHAAFLGVDLDPSFETAAVVGRVHPGSAAARAGLQPGDAIWSLNGRTINAREDLSLLISQMQPGESVAIRFGRPQSVEVLLGQRGSPDESPPSGPGAPEGFGRPVVQPMAVRDRENSRDELASEAVDAPDSESDSDRETASDRKNTEAP